MSYCKVCMSPHSPYILNNKKVCLNCDDLLFDVEIESEEFEKVEEKAPSKEKSTPSPAVKRTKPTMK